MKLFDPNNAGLCDPSLVLSHGLDDVFFASFIKNAHDFMLDRMDQSYGYHAVKHSIRVGDFSARMLIAGGMETASALEHGENMYVHDLGKAHDTQIPYWVLTSEKPSAEKSNKAAKSLHAALGPETNDQVLDIMGYKRDQLNPQQQRRLKNIDYLQVNHHQPYDPEMGPIIRVICVSDAIDGQLKTLGHKFPEDMSADELYYYRNAAIDKLRGEKYDGLYDPAMLNLAQEVNDGLKPAERKPYLEFTPTS